jgi:inorganic pyrophosphatase
VTRVDLSRLPAFVGDDFQVVVESPRGSTVKLKYDPSCDVMRWGRPLTLGLSYPFDWGFIPGTRAADGDPLDAMVIWEGPTFPGVVIPCRALAVARIEQDTADHSARQRNDRILAVPVNAHRSPDHLSQRLKDELEAFFLQATAFEQKRVVVLGWDDRDGAARLIRESVHGE